MTENTPLQEERTSKTTLSIQQANRYGLILMPVVIFFLGVPYGLIHGFDGLMAPFFEWKNLLLFIPVFLMSVILHEGLHGLGFIFFSTATAEDVKYGMKWKEFTPYAHCEIPVEAFSYRIAIFLPTLVLGVLPYLLGVFTGSPRWTIYGIIMAIAGLGDFMVLWLIRKLANETLVQDHPSEVGCLVLEKVE